MVLTKGRKAAKRKYISLRGRSMRVRYERFSDQVASENSFASISNDVSSADTNTMSIQAGMPTLFDVGNKELEDPGPQFTTYQKQKSKRVENWNAIQDQLLQIGIEVTFMPSSHTCISCAQNVDQIFRCMDCGTSALYCQSCLAISHSLPHLHMFEAFKNGTFIYINVDTPVWTRPDSHSCMSSYHQDIVIIDDKGRQHKRVMQFCSCELPAETMLRSYLWPSSPKKPVLAFHIGLLEWLTALMLECQVSAKGFCETLKAKHSKHQQGLIESEVNNVYKILMKECLIQYRNFQHKLRHPKHLCEDLGTGTQCPACFQNPKKIVSFDADFQLVRKLASGYTTSKPKHEGNFFLDQMEVDKFIDNYSSGVTKNEVECNEFQAGNALRSKVKNKKLDVTAVFGSTCRHEFPYLFFNLKHGERIGYSVFLLEKIVAENKNVDIHVMYDIACLLESHLKKNQRMDLLDAVKLSIPAFHCYGHKMACQILYNPRRTIGLGLSDGECVERLWSFLGKFSNISKEMTPENRIDLLVDGLIHYGQKVTRKQGKALSDKLLRAEDLRQKSSQMLQETLGTISGVSAHDLRQWSVAEKQLHATNSTIRNGNKNQFTPSETYAVNLKKYFHFSQAILAVEDPEVKDDMKKKISRTEQDLKRYETAFKTQRWSLGMEAFRKNIDSAKKKKLHTMIEKMQKMMAERSFLLELMKKYARGQAVAIRVGKLLKKVNATLKRMLAEYNMEEGPKAPYPEKLDFDTLKLGTTGPEVADDVKRVLIDLLETVDRCEEEIDMIKTEMNCIIKYYQKQHESVYKVFHNSVNRVDQSVLLSEGLNIEKKLAYLREMFKGRIDIEHIPLNFHTIVQVTEPYLGGDIDEIILHLASDEIKLEEADEDEIEDDTEALDDDDD
ncbi:hypothetical protein ACJMK2_009696 [Sinanodonta woodiana]|uniref:CxC2-like cysteine cluster KDZ transposase-associated domain-containing protein n=1 Tax=Sinanodonta woodiana TaxID=1069815 RepID=A0ABD3VD12_SINWO